MKDKIHKTNAARHLDDLSIPYELIPYPVDEEDLSAQHVAASLNENIDQVYKTLVLRGERTGLFVCVIPGAAELDLKLAAKAAGVKSVSMLHVADLLKVTGYVRGGCSPVGMKKRFPTLIDETAQLFDEIHVSGGRRGLSLIIAPDELARFCDATLADIVR